MISRYSKIFVSLFVVFLAGCKVDILVPTGGSVISESGNLNCVTCTTCTIDVADTSFLEVYIAEPDDGYAFAGWKKDKGRW